MAAAAATAGRQRQCGSEHKRRQWRRQQDSRRAYGGDDVGSCARVVAPGPSCTPQEPGATWHKRGAARGAGSVWCSVCPRTRRPAAVRLVVRSLRPGGPMRHLSPIQPGGACSYRIEAGCSRSCRQQLPATTLSIKSRCWPPASGPGLRHGPYADGLAQAWPAVSHDVPEAVPSRSVIDVIDVPQTTTAGEGPPAHSPHVRQARCGLSDAPPSPSCGAVFGRTHRGHGPTTSSGWWVGQHATPGKGMTTASQ